jgi:hypothetical protein
MKSQLGKDWLFFNLALMVHLISFNLEKLHTLFGILVLSLHMGSIHLVTFGNCGSTQCILI